MTSTDETKDEKSSDKEETEKAPSEEKDKDETSESTSNGPLEPPNGEATEDLNKDKDNVSNKTDSKEKEEVSKENKEEEKENSKKDTRNGPEDKEDKAKNEDIELKSKTPTRASKRKLQEVENEERVDIKTEEIIEDEGFEGFPSDSTLPFDAHFMETPSSGKDNTPRSIPEFDVMGKGKRARIPNKRYSEIALSNSRKSHGAKSATSSDMEVDEIVIKEEPVDSPTTVRSPQLSQPPSAKKPRREGPDLKDPRFLKPFKYGWKRELVWRAQWTNGKRNGDIYYYTPAGKKVRSMREVSECIDHRALTMDNFTYYKATLDLNDPSKEIIRNAKVSRSDKDDSTPSKGTPLKTITIKHPLVKSVGRPKKILSPNAMSPKVVSPKVMSPRVVLSKLDASTPKDKVTAASKDKATAKEVKVKKEPVTESPTNKKNSTKVVIRKNPLRSPETTKSPGKEATKTPAKAVETTPAGRPLRKARSAANTPVKEESPEVMSSPSPVRFSPLKTKIAKINGAKNKKILRGKRTTTTTGTTNSNSSNHTDDKPEAKFMENYLQNLSFGYNTLLYVFQYLKVQDLLRAGCVCTMWRDIASHPILWKTVRMKNSQVHSFNGLANTLRNHGTINLDLRKMLLPNTGDEIWPEFSKAIEKVDTLRKIELCRCPASVVEQLAVTNPKLEVINAVTIKCEVMSLETLKNLTTIRELRLKATNGLNISSIDSLKELKTLRILSLTSVNELHKLNLDVLGDLNNLEQLDLGECTDFPKNFGKDILSRLRNLERLRLEKGQAACHTFDILDAVKSMSKLEQLELVNFDVKSGFDKALGGCANIKKLMIIPTYISQSATTNNMVLSGVLRLQGSLSHFVWGVTLELLRVTELFVDQCEESKEKKEKKPTGNGDSIPVLKPVPDLTHSKEIPVACNPPQVEILPLPNLQKLLLNSLPTTRVKILKIPFHATWRQTLTDSV